MSRKPFFIECKTTASEYWDCDKCGLKIKDIKDGKRYWNPNPRAKHKNICQNCYDVLQYERIESYNKWREKYANLEHIQSQQNLIEREK